MKIKVTQEDINAGSDPIKTAVRREYGIDVTVDSRFMVVKGNEQYPRRLPLSAEAFQVKLATGQAVEPFSFEI